MKFISLLLAVLCLSYCKTNLNQRKLISVDSEPSATGINNSGENTLNGSSNEDDFSSNNQSQQFTPNQTFSSESSANECSNLWAGSDLGIQYDRTKNYSGDTLAAYGLMTYKKRGFRDQYVLKIKGKMPAARFISFETYKGATQQKVNEIFDYQILGQNKMESTHKYLGQDYEIFLTGLNQADIEGSLNLKVANTKLLSAKHSLFYRVYLPLGLKSIAKEDLPKIYSYDLNGEPKDCPTVYTPKPLELPQSFITRYKAPVQKSEIIFGAAPSWFNFLGLGANSAVPSYVVGFNYLTDSKVSVLKFKAPTFTNQSNQDNPQVRYWSMCFQNWANNQTLACLSDVNAKIDSSGFVSIVFARANSEIESIANQLNMNFISDTRVSGQNAIGFAYRNLFPNTEFEQQEMYLGEYLPVGLTCEANDFINETNRLNKCIPK